MSFSSDVIRVSKDGEKIAGFFESESTLPCYKALYDKFKDYFTVKVDKWYDTSAIIEDLSKQYNISMTDYYVSEDGWRVWVQEQDVAINIPLSEINSTEENYYTLLGSTVIGICNEPSKYKNWVYKHNKSYIVTQDDLSKVLSYFPKKHYIHSVEMDDNIIIYNSY